MACKKDITPTKSDLMIKSIDYDFKSLNSVVLSNYDFEYSENNILTKVNLEGFLALNQGAHSPFSFTTKYNGNIFELDKNLGQSEINNFNGEDQQLVLNNLSKISESNLRYVYVDPTFGNLVISVNSKFNYLDGNLDKITKSSGLISGFIFLNNNLSSFISNKVSAVIGNPDSTITYSLGYHSTLPDTSVIKVNGINNLILCIPFEVQETLPFLVVDDRLSLTGKKQNYLINSISVEEKRNNITQKTTTYTINYLYDLEGRITHVQWINNATLAIYREAVIGYL